MTNQIGVRHTFRVLYYPDCRCLRANIDGSVGWFRSSFDPQRVWGGQPRLSAAALAAAVLVTAAAAACGSGSPDIGATPSALPSQSPAVPLAAPHSPRRIVYDSSLISDPLPASSSARVSMSAAQAIDIAARQTTVGSAQQPGRP